METQIKGETCLWWSSVAFSSIDIRYGLLHHCKDGGFEYKRNEKA
jgi:hypothetical protein